MKRNFQKFIAILFTVFCISSTLVLFACSPDSVQTSGAGEKGFSRSYNQGQLILDQRTDKKESTIAEQLELVLEASAPENIGVEFPTYSASLGDFTLLDVKSHPARITGIGDDVRVIHAVTYLLEPYLPGTYTIPPMTVKYLDRNNAAEPTQLTTEELQVTVKSLMGQGDGSVEIKDIRGPLSLPQNTALQILLGATVLLLIIIGVTGFLYWRKISNKKQAVPVQLRPEEIALQELDRLLAENLLTRGEVKLFHLKISDILRHYIENRFGLKAPERTTEEFLTELSVARSQENSLLGSHKPLLADFLIHCDLVKFAKHEPTVAESETTVSICREFIEKTKEKVSRGQGAKVSRVQGKKI
jgi:hypothetical protein